MTYAPRTISLRGRSSIGHYKPSNLDPTPPAYSPGGGVLPPVGNPQLGAWQVDQGSGNPQLSAMSPSPPPVNYEPGGGEMPPPNYEPGGGQQVYGAAGYAMPAWSPPTPPPRPGGLGGILSRAVVPSTPTPPPRPQVQPVAAVPSSNGFSMITAPNSDPTARNRPQMSALDLSGLFGGLFGGR